MARYGGAQPGRSQSQTEIAEDLGVTEADKREYNFVITGDSPHSLRLNWYSGTVWQWFK